MPGRVPLEAESLRYFRWSRNFMSIRPCVIGIAGPSGSGKTYVAEAIAERRNGTVLSLDHYYLDLSQLTVEERARCNFDDPISLDWELAVGQVAELRQGRAIERPEYDFAAHTRRPESTHAAPGWLVVVDGIFALFSSEMRALYDLKVFVDLADETCFARRLERDTRERGRTRESVIRQYAETVRPMCEKFVLPARAFADIIVPGDQDVEESVRTILAAASIARS